jgi:hypothetical protein
MAYVLQLELSLRTAHERIRQLEAQLHFARAQEEEEAVPVVGEDSVDKDHDGSDRLLEQVLADAEGMGMCFGE